MTKSPKKKNGMYERCVTRITNMSYSSLFLVWVSMAFSFGCLYFGLSYLEGHGPLLQEGIPMTHRFWNSIYYSIITATSTGYGDIVPHGISKGFAAIQSISALFIFAVFVTKLVSHRQEMTLMEVHRLTFEDVFHNTREGLFICRKDFDHIIEEAEDEKELDDEHWENLTIAYRQMQTLLQEIPDFYANDIHLYTIDEKREKLLIESVKRTLHRINQMLDMLSSKGINWASHTESMQELEEMTRMVDTITPLWKERSPHDSNEAFADILKLKESVHKHVNASLPLN